MKKTKREELIHTIESVYALSKTKPRDITFYGEIKVDLSEYGLGKAVIETDGIFQKKERDDELVSVEDINSLIEKIRAGEVLSGNLVFVYRDGDSDKDYIDQKEMVFDIGEETITVS